MSMLPFCCSKLFGSQTYYVSVAAGVDAAIVVALCVMLDEMENENS
jgi:uncharacterized protein YxjI